ncbi:MAG: carbamoyl phosphate synthase small subunit [Acidocella sp. 20-57-95]|nr:MAG: carbamoyl phosphate synthase small subunit [Acidocella sp. 20-57-95]HQT64442.1 glutamine-hydrolyzing carbamoyl-phosphate synthase small subunit [Acidocella sp.]
MPISIADLLDRLGGTEAAATLTGVSAEAIRKWRSANAIPSRHWPAIMAATGLNLQDLPGTAMETDTPPGATAALVLADGTVFWGRGFGAHGTSAPSELCFSTGLTGYQETLTDPSFAGQIINFTFPHIGNVGTNDEDLEATTIAARGLVTGQDPTEPSNYRATSNLDHWLKKQNVPGIAGVDTRAVTLRIRDLGAPNAVLSYPADGKFDLAALTATAAAWGGLDGLDLAKEVSCTQSYEWTAGTWSWEHGFAAPTATHTVVAVDYGAKRNILRSLASAGCKVIVVPATSGAEDILRHKPDGVFLSNGPGDPAATAEYAVPAIQGVMAAGVPIFGICLGHQLLATALGGKTYKLARGHRGANQPVQDLTTGKVEITSQNHGFAVDEASLPAGVDVTHKSLFDGSNEGIECKAKRVFSVQYHPEASPGPSDSSYLFKRFVEMMA